MAERKISTRKISSNEPPVPAPNPDHHVYTQHGNLHPSGGGAGPNEGRFKVSQVSDDEEEGSSTDVDSDLDDAGGQASQTTHASRYSKSIGHIVDVLPKVEHFRQQDSVNGLRPTIDELQGDQMRKEVKEVEGEPEMKKGKVIKFGWLEGVLMRCLLNIWGVMLFLRLSWVIGQAGIVEGFLVISLANLVTFVTAISMSAVATNGIIKGGGIYYMISRSLGPEFGAAIGLMFTVANSIAVSLYIVGFCESLNDLFTDNNIGYLIDGGENDIRAIGSIVLVAILILAFVGMDWVTRTQMFLLVVLIAAQLVFIVGTIMGPQDDEERAKGFVGYNYDTFKNNFLSDYRKGPNGDNSDQSFFSVFGVFFPAVTGIVAGANLSGDLKDPSSAIPKGTLLAITITYVSYFGYGFMMGGCVDREASGNVTQYLETVNYSDHGVSPPDGFIGYQDCTTEDGENICKYGLLNSTQVMELTSIFGYLIYAGCFAATLSSAIASLVGAPRVLQALAKDRLYPLLHFFAKGYGANNDPIRGYILVFFISLGCLAIAKLNAIAPLLSNFFLAAYCLINFSVFHATISKSPGWRPSFKYYNAWVSLAGSVLCIAVMFLMSWITATITVVISVTLFLYVSYRKSNVNWGSSTQAQSFTSALKGAQDLIGVQDHVKNYRPQVLVLSGLPASRPALVDLGYLLVKNTSLMICGHVVQGPIYQRERNTLVKNSYAWLTKHEKRGFYSMVEGSSVQEGAHNLMQIAGLGKFKPNMVLMGFKHDWTTCSSSDMHDYFQMINETLHLHLAIGILRVDGGLDYSGIIAEEGQVTVEDLLMESRNEGGTGTRPANQTQTEQPKVEAPAPTAVAAVSTVNEDRKAKKARKVSVSAMYQGTDPIKKPSREILNNVTRFRRTHTGKCIDVWWMYDDGGLTLLLPYLLTKRKQYAGCKLRVFTLAPGGQEELGAQQTSMATLLARLRIDCSDVIVIPENKTKAKESTRREFDELTGKLKAAGEITDEELKAHKEKTNRHLRLREHLLEYSKESAFIAMTMLIPRKGSVSPALYLAWLEILTRGMPPFLLARGNQSSVFTFYA